MFKSKILHPRRRTHAGHGSRLIFLKSRGAYMCGLLLIVAALYALVVYRPQSESYSSQDENVVIDLKPVLPEMKQEIPDPAPNLDGVHVLISSGCSPKQNWQCETQMYSWGLLKHPGKMTRIVSGCENDEQKEAAKKSAVENINIFFTEDFCEMDRVVMKDKWEKKVFCHLWNKPMSVLTFFEQKSLTEAVYILLDPDMILTKQFETHLPTSGDRFVHDGHAVHQRYGYSDNWNRWGFCSEPGCKKGASYDREHYVAGPPYMMTLNDWRRLTPLWVQYSHQTRRKLWENDDLMFEMYSFSLASAHLGINTTVSQDWMLSSVDTPREGWDQLHEPDDHHAVRIEGPLLHYCQTYRLCGESEWTKGTCPFLFIKHNVPKDILANCDRPLLKELPLTKEMIAKDPNPKKRNVFMIHWLIKYVNGAVTNYKNKYCETWNQKRAVVQQVYTGKEWVLEEE